MIVYIIFTVTMVNKQEMCYILWWCDRCVGAPPLQVCIMTGSPIIIYLHSVFSEMSDLY